ncbi:MAG: Holliday junction branch migration protein RuvA [Rickettsiales bacterium]|nr:Holliday junction branch migration protein RuvA [Rickettsiales bacterium]
MIGKLRGKVDSIDTDTAIIDVGGVGYLVYASHKTLGQLPQAGEATELIIETHVREDHIHLYGFTSAVERDWFRILTTVQGVGVRMALAILGTYSPAEIMTAIAAKDKKALTVVSGVGPKLAERIITELKSKVDTLPTSDTVIDMPSHAGQAPKASGVGEDAISALVNLGYNRTDAYLAVNNVLKQHGDASLDDAIRLGLKELAS